MRRTCASRFTRPRASSGRAPTRWPTRTSEEYIARMPGKPADDEATGTRKRRIERVDVTGNAATGKIVLDYPDAYIVDYMSLLKTNGEWKIINKIFMTEMKKK
jgi:hypothetical protein